MAWIRIDDQIAHHPKFLKAGPTASWLWVGCIAYAQRYLTDGFVPGAAVPSLSTVKRVAASLRILVDVGLLDKTVGGYRVHDYLEYNSSASEIQADRNWDRFRKELYSQPDLVRSIKQRDRNRCRYCDIEVNWSDRRGPSGGQFDHIKARGPNTLDNVVVACRRCNIRKGNRSTESCGMTLLAPKELVRNQVGTSSDLDLRARASYPSVPVPVQEQIQEAPAAPVHGNGNGHRTQSHPKGYRAKQFGKGRPCPHTPVCPSFTVCTTRCLEEGKGAS